jgi:hypothetical protein
MDYEVVFVDATENPIERTKKVLLGQKEASYTKDASCCG